MSRPTAPVERPFDHAIAVSNGRSTRAPGPDTYAEVVNDHSRIPVAITIAGSDSGGGAGIQADLKAFARCGVHGTSAITAITAQSTLGVDAVHSVPAEIIVAQVRSVAEDI